MLPVEFYYIWLFCCRCTGFVSFRYGIWMALNELAITLKACRLNENRKFSWKNSWNPTNVYRFSYMGHWSTNILVDRQLRSTFDHKMSQIHSWILISNRDKQIKTNSPWSRIFFYIRTDKRRNETLITRSWKFQHYTEDIRWIYALSMVVL